MSIFAHRNVQMCHGRMQGEDGYLQGEQSQEKQNL